MTRPLSVLYFSNELARGGAEQHVLTLLHGLDRERFRPHLACTPELAERLGPDLPADVELHRLRLRSPRDGAAILQLASILRRRRIDVLHSHLFFASVFASPIGRLCGVPLVVETPHVRESWRRGWLKSRYTVDRFIGRFVHRYVAVSAANARYLMEEKGLPAEKVVVIRNGCDVSRFDPERPAPPDLRSSLGFAPQDPVLVILGRLEPQKGHRVAIEALPEILGEFPSTRLVCVGDGNLREALEREVVQRGLGASVRFVGYQPDPAEWLALADLAVLPSFYEGLPLAAIESLAAGRATVATAVDGTPEVVIDGQTGLTVPPGDAACLALAIRRLLRDPALRRDLGRAGRERVVTSFSRERQLRETQRFYLREWAARSGNGLFLTPAAPARPQPARAERGRR